MSNAAGQIPPWDPRAQEAVDPVQEAAEIPVPSHAHRRILLQQMEQALEFVGAQCVTGHGRGRGVWLLLCRKPATDELKCYLSNGLAEMAPDRLVWLAGLRWPIEQCFRDGK